MNKYTRDVRHLESIDVYRVIELFEVKHPALQHAVKKMLCAGQRGVKDFEQDVKEAIQALERALEMGREDAGNTSNEVEQANPFVQNLATGDAEAPARDDDPHAEPRKTWKPGQRWQTRFPGNAEWEDVVIQEPSWCVYRQYRRHPEDKDTPWYPDDSGEWVEVPDDVMECPVERGVVVMVCRERDRERREGHGNFGTAKYYDWDLPIGHIGRIVAYKVVK